MPTSNFIVMCYNDKKTPEKPQRFFVIICYKTYDYITFCCFFLAAERNIIICFITNYNKKTS